MVGRQLERGQRPGKRGLPEPLQALPRLSGEPPLLPAEVVGVRRGHRGEHRCGTPSVERSEVAQQHDDRPEVGDQMVDHQQQKALLRRADEQAPAGGRPGLQVERPAGHHVQAHVELAAAPAGGAHHHEVRRERRIDPLPGPPIHGEERGAQSRMPLGQRRQGEAEDRRIEGAVEPRRGGEVVDRALRRQPVQEPERLLPDPQSEAARLVGLPLQLLRSGRSLGRRRQDVVGERGDRGSAEQLGHRQFDAEGGFHLLLQGRRAERVEPQGGQGNHGRKARRRPTAGGDRGMPQPGDQSRPPLLQGERGDLRGRARGAGLVRAVLPVRTAAPADDDEISAQVGFTAGSPPDLAARGLEQGARPEQDHLVDPHLVGLGDRLANGPGDRLRVDRHLAPAVDLGGDHQPLLTLRFDRERSGSAWQQVRVARLGRDFEILRIMVAAAQDDQVLAAAGDEQLTAAQEAEIPRAQEGVLRHFSHAAGQALAEVPRRRLGLVPIAGGDARAGDPDLPHPSRKQLAARLRVDDRHALFHPGLAAADQPPPRFPLPRFLAPTGREPCRGEAARFPPRAGRAAGDEERRFGQAVTGREGLPAEPLGREGRGKAVERLRPYRLGTVEGDRPGGEVEPLALLRGDLLAAELIGEVGAAAGRHAR